MGLNWSVENVPGLQQVNICYSDMCASLLYTQAAKFAQKILGFTGSGGTTSASRTAGPARGNRAGKTGIGRARRVPAK